jgi:hypothetical protein
LVLRRSSCYVEVMTMGAHRCVWVLTPRHICAPIHCFNATGTLPQHQRDHHLLNMPLPPLPTPRLRPLPDPLAHAPRVQRQHPPRPTARATPPPAPRPAANSPAGLYSASDRTPLGAPIRLCQSKLYLMLHVSLWFAQRRSVAIEMVALKSSPNSPHLFRVTRCLPKGALHILSLVPTSHHQCAHAMTMSYAILRRTPMESKGLTCARRVMPEPGGKA